MKLFTAMLMAVSGWLVVGMVSTARAQQNNSFTGTVEQVWEDGFRLNMSNQTLRVDSWKPCRDLTARHVSVGDRLTVTGEFERGEFDAFSISDSEGVRVCPPRNR